MKAVLESYDNRRPIIKRESLRGLFVKGKKTMNNEKIGGMTISRIQLEKAEYKLYGYSSGCSVFESGEKEEESNYARWTTDVYKLDEHSKPVIDVNGNFVFLHREGDIKLDSKGEPIVAPHEGYISRPCGRQHVGEIRTMDHDEFSVVFEEVQKEAKRRLIGGQPLSYDDNPHVVASI